MTGEVAFFDTNILLYMHDHRDPGKQHRADEAFRKHSEANTLVISTQVIQEFYVIATRKLFLPAAQAKEWIERLCDLRPIPIDAAKILRAADLAGQFHLSFWDALILAAAEAAGASVLLSEDFNDGQLYGSVRVQNPLRAA
jgi:predicted nucleic acid-binding protein